MTGSTWQAALLPALRAAAHFTAAIVLDGCGEVSEPWTESVVLHGQPGIEEMQLSACEAAELERALLENSGELEYARAESAELQANAAGAPQALGEKANLHLSIAVNSSTPSGVAIPGGPARPDAIAKVENGKAYFWRPDLRRRYYLLVPSETPTAYFYAAVLAAHDLEGALASDCLADLFTVIWQEDYALLHPLQRERSSLIELGYSELACINLAGGCSNSPRLEELGIAAGVTERRMRLGSYLGLETDYDSPRDEDDAPDLTPASARAVLLHELSHILGFDHPRYSELQPELDERTLRVPQSSQGTVPSFLFTTASPLFSSVPTPEDRRVLGRVYGGDCNYRADFRLLGEVCSDDAELRCQAHGGSCEVSLLAGDRPQERCRWHNFRDADSCARYSAGSWEISNASDATTVFAGEAGACLATELPDCSPDSALVTQHDVSGHCCTLFGDDDHGLFFEAFATAAGGHYFCSHQRGLGDPPDAWEFSAAAELAELTLLDAGSGATAAGWFISSGELVQQLELPGNLALSRGRMRSGCVMTSVTTDAAGESGIVFNYRTPANYHVFDVLPNVHRRIRQVIDGVSIDLSVEPWSAPRDWATAVELAVCYGDGIHTFIGGQLGSRVSVDQRVDFFGSGGRVGLWNEHNPGARHAYLRAHSLVEGYALLRH